MGTALYIYGTAYVCLFVDEVPTVTLVCWLLCYLWVVLRLNVFYLSKFLSGPVKNFMKEIWSADCVIVPVSVVIVTVSFV
jgi:hypothetical protein